MLSHIRVIRIVAAFLCLVLVCADLLIPSTAVQAEDSRTVGRYVLEDVSLTAIWEDNYSKNY